MWAPRFALACFVCPPGCAAPCEATNGVCPPGACAPGFRDGRGAAPCASLGADTSKRGVAAFLAGNGGADYRALQALTWFYNWGDNPAPVTMSQPGRMLQYVPMQGYTLGDVDGLPERTAGAQPRPLRQLLTFNEPNHVDQANMYPADAAAAWPAMEAAAARMGGLRIGAPSASGCGGGPLCLPGYNSHFDWLDDFFANCSGCQVDFMNMHVYTCSHQAVTDAILAMRRYSRPIWMTEFACVLGSSTWPPTTANNLRVQLEFANATLRALDGDPWVERYAWFSERWPYGRPSTNPSSDLLEPGASSALTALGRLYTGAVS